MELSAALNQPDSPPRVEMNEEISDCPLLVEGIHKRFGEQHVLKGVSLSLSKGESTALLGSNGSGKSTLLRTIPRLLEADSGSVTLLGKETKSLSRTELKELRSKVGFVFQKHNLVPRLSALTNTLHGALGRTAFAQAWFQSFAPQSLREEAFECLKKVGLAAHSAKQTRYLSGGQSQRVAIARALMQRPEIVLADEPVASLDPEAGENIMRLLRKLSTEESITLLFTTHHLEHALEYADRIIGLVNGEVALDCRSSDTSIDELRGFYDS